MPDNFESDSKVYPGAQSEPAVITVQGNIEQGDDRKFRQIASQQPDAIVILDSPGGAIVPAMEIGRTIRLREYTTTVATDGFCTSACALIWVAGSRRTLFEGAKLGFHASYRNVDGTLVEAGLGNALVGHYLSQLGMGEKSVIFATAAPPDQILWLNSETSALSAISYETIPNGKTSPAAGGTANVPRTPSVTTPVASRSQAGPGYDRLLAKTSETIRNVEAFARGLRQKGFQAEIDRSDSKMPSIITGVSGHKIAVSFSSCVGDNCQYAEIMSSWKQVNAISADRLAMAWRSEENYSSVLYAPGSQDLAVYHYIVLGSEGVTLDNMIENLQYFVSDYENIGRKLISISQ